MTVAPETFLEGLLGGAMSDIDGTAEKRLARLHRRLGAAPWRLPDLSPGERVAMSWLCEMAALHAASALFPGRVLWVNFDHFLNAPEAGLEDVLRHFGAGDAAAVARAILAGPTMNQYAKQPTCRFDARHRADLLRQSRERHAAEIRKGLDWLDQAAVTFPAVQGAADAAGQTKS
jgi:hypothetical protein